MNTSFFHQLACHKKRRNMITAIKHGNTIATNEDEIAEEVDSYYSNVLGTASARAHSINLEALQLPMRNLEHLDVPFSEEEVERVIKAIPLTKHPVRTGLRGDSTCHVGRSSRPI